MNMVLTLPSENLCPSTVQIDMAQLSGEYLVIMKMRRRRCILVSKGQQHFKRVRLLTFQIYPDTKESTPLQKRILNASI